MHTSSSSTPPPQPEADSTGRLPRGPLTPEQQRRIVGGNELLYREAYLLTYVKEINRMKAKALRERLETEGATEAAVVNTSRVSGVKRSFASMTTSGTPSTLRDGRANTASTDRPLDMIRPTRNFTKYVEYDFSKMTDTKGGFLTQEDDPHNKALHGREGKVDQKPANMTQKEWEQSQLLRSMRHNRVGPFEPALSTLDDKSKQKVCRECESLEIDWKWEDAFRCLVCGGCKEKFPEKYSLLTKTEAKEDYLLTDRE
jgi:DNA-repair protein complementing XP-A cells